MSTQNSGLSSEFVEALFCDGPQVETSFGAVYVSVVMFPLWLFVLFYIYMLTAGHLCFICC